MPSFSTLSELFHFGSSELKKNKISNYHKEAEWLLLDIINKNSSWLSINKQQQPTNQQIESYTESIYKRSDHIPLQLIMGKASFYGRDFILYPDVFIPRADSEVIIDIIKKKTFQSAIDIACGTGCIGITVSLECPDASIDLLDVSEIAISNTNRNIQYLKPTSIGSVFNEDIIKNHPHSSYDIIISNPPYISLKDVVELEHSVKYYDPLDALSDLKDGIYFYQRIYDLSDSMLNDGGIIILEFGTYQQAKEIINIFKGFRYKIYNDMAHNPRVIEFQK